MKKPFTLRFRMSECVALLIGLLFANGALQAQIYLHDFGTTTISAHPYTVAPGTFDANLSNSSWVNSTSAWTSFAGSSGQAISLSNSGGTPAITLTFDVASGYELSVTSFDFWRRRSSTGAQNWSMTINGIAVGSGTVPTTGAALGTTAVSNPVNGQTGTITVILSLSGATTTGTFRLDDFTLNGSVTPLAGNTVVEFVSTSSSAAENSGSSNLALAITNFSTTTATNVTISATGATGRVSSFTSPVVFPANNGSNQNCVVNLSNNGLCDGDEDVTFTITGITGGQGTPVIGTNSAHVLTVTDDDVCTSVQLTAISNTVSEGVGTVTITGAITDFSTSVATTVDLVLLSGDATRINNYTTQTLTFPANDGSDQSVTITVTDNGLCDGTEVLDFQLQNIAGGQGTPFIGAADQHELTITDNEGTLGEVIARQAFDGLGSDTWAILSGSGNISTDAGASDFPSNERVLSSSASWQVNNGSATLDLATVDVSGYNNIVLTARLSSTAGTSGNGADTGDEMEFFVDLDGAGFPANGDILILGNSNAQWGYSTGTGVASTTAGTDLTFQPAGGGGRTTDGYSFISISIPDGTQTIALSVDALNNSANETWNLDDIQVTGDRCNTIYYSRNTGNVGDAIWSLNPVGTGTTVTFDRFKSAVVQSGHTVTLNADTRVEDLTVDAGGTLALDANTLTVSGDAFGIAGSMTAADDSEVLLNGTSLITLESAAALDLYDLTLDAPNDVLSDATISIRGTLALMDGEFDTSLGAVTLSSTATGTGRLGPVGSGASYTGNMTVQRYIPAGATNWRLMGSPVAGQTIEEWNDDYITAGFPGSNAPGFDNPVGSGILWPSIRWYDETNTFADIDSGLVGVSSTAQALTQGQGFAAWCGDGLNTTAAFTVDVTGAPHIASAAISLPMDHTDTSNPTIDGWNLVSNPVPSPILFSNITRTNVDDYVTYFDPATGNTGVWDISLGVGTNNATDTIQSSQAFYLKANAAAPVAEVEEADKVVGNDGGFFGGDQQSLFTGVRLRISSAINQFSDETLVHFGAGTPATDNEDVPKVIFSHPGAPHIATRSSDGDLFAINAHGEYDTDIAIPVMVDVTISGTYTVTAGSMENIGLSCLVLEDLLTGSSTMLVEGATYSFDVNADADNTVPRLRLIASAPVAFYAEPATCNGVTNGSASVVHTGIGPMDITWTNEAGTIILEQTIEDGVASITALPAGAYGVEVSSTAGCGALNTSFRIEEPAELEALGNVSAATCANTEGLVDVTILGGTMPYTFLWSNGSTDEDLSAVAGTYDVVVTDANGCMLESTGHTIEAGTGPTAIASVSGNTVLVNVELEFTNDTQDADMYSWDFGDGNTSEVAEPTHAWSEPGTYTVSLTVSDGTCTDTWTDVVVVETSTSIATVTAAVALNAWYANDRFVVEHGFDNGKPVTIEVMDATGRLHITRQATGSPARVSIPTAQLTTGIWFLRVTNDQYQRTMRVPLVR
ncbi:MAG: PKD domain-containing protein [Flavobacteriales bacterium]|nr:PKD domain-containing protein [Flavobacteriales bacterium]